MENLFDYLMKNYGFPGYSTISEVVEYVKTLYPKYPVAPVRPNLYVNSCQATPDSLREQATNLEKYNELMITYNQERDEYQEKEREINQSLAKFIKEMSGMGTSSGSPSGVDRDGFQPPSVICNLALS